MTGAKKAASEPGPEPEAAPTSKYFRAARERAKRIIDSPEKLEQVAEASAKKAEKRTAPGATVMDDFRTLIRLVIAYARGQYREIPLDALITVVAGLIYVVSPLDLIPDALPGGLVDDAVVIAWVIRTVNSELVAFRKWEAEASAV